MDELLGKSPLVRKLSFAPSNDNIPNLCVGMTLQQPHVHLQYNQYVMDVITQGNLI